MLLFSSKWLSIYIEAEYEEGAEIQYKHDNKAIRQIHEIISAVRYTELSICFEKLAWDLCGKQIRASIREA